MASQYVSISGNSKDQVSVSGASFSLPAQSFSWSPVDPEDEEAEMERLGSP